MAEEAGEQVAKQITFNVKSSSDNKYVITVPEDLSVLDLKKKLSTSEYADIPAERQRLIYSGRVLKDADELSVYKIKDGNTVHMVKGAASNQRQAPASQSGSSSVPPGAGNPASNVPSTFATGTGSDPLAGLTGARYAGFAQLPGADQFGPDGGMGPPQGPEEMLRMLDNPMFQSQMNEAMNNPHVIQMMQNSPAVRNNPWLRQMLENPEARRMMMDPAIIRQSMQMSQMMGGRGGMGGDSMPVPGVTDTTPRAEGAASDGGASATPGQTNATGAPNAATQQNPFAGMFGGPGMGAGAGAGGNPFATLFGPGAGGAGMPGSLNPSGGNNATGTDAARSAEGQTDPSQNPPPNPFSNLFTGMGAASGQEPQQGQQPNPFGNMMQQMMQNPQMMQTAMQMMGMGGSNAQPGIAGTDSTGAQANPFASLFGPGGMGAGGLGGGMGSPPPPQQDSRPPEEMYAEQLRQLNDMGFYEFDRNVRALRMAGGNVQGAVEVLLGGS